MKLTIINGSNRIQNRTLIISTSLAKIAKDQKLITNLITLENFTTLFRGDYLDVSNTNGDQKSDLIALDEADLVIFVVPIYHHSLTSAIKNFLDLVDVNLYANKVFGYISSHESKDFGVREVKVNVDGIIPYRKHISISMPRIEIVDYNEPNLERIKSYLNYCISFTSKFL
ncbi:MAG: NAD(P)H-dependent oxidoreductase [Candidatus Dojkabacteria bacterium]|nr:NAD(P)H-dependent oxidoreductase [Candidatus Dojkabacteria bacterium]MDQ7020582.1 NAD(P)H-dependent oxidoreductase [Candidatus Dojkabacteria bacterium]